MYWRKKWFLFQNPHKAGRKGDWISCSIIQEIWKNTKADDYRLPLLMPTPEEGAEYSEKLSDIRAYADEMFLKFIFVLILSTTFCKCSFFQ